MKIDEAKKESCLNASQYLKPKGLWTFHRKHKWEGFSNTHTINHSVILTGRLKLGYEGSARGNTKNKSQVGKYVFTG